MLAGHEFKSATRPYEYATHYLMEMVMIALEKKPDIARGDADKWAMHIRHTEDFVKFRGQLENFDYENVK